MAKVHKRKLLSLESDLRNDKAVVKFLFQNDRTELPFYVQMFNLKDPSVGKILSFHLVLLLGPCGNIYKDEREFEANNKFKLAPELLSSKAGSPAFSGKLIFFSQIPSAIINGKITSVKTDTIIGTKFIHIVINCFGFEFDLFAKDGNLPEAKVGYIISGMFYVYGKEIFEANASAD